MFRMLFRLLLRETKRRSRDSGRPPVVVVHLKPEPVSERILRGQCWVVDGDTIVIDGTHIRIAGIDAPELDHPWGKKSKWTLVQMCKGQVVTARLRPDLSYDRVVAECFLPDGRDIAAELVRAGMALDWPKFSGGRYRHLEAPDARKRLWRADARQRGKLPPKSEING
ncbi:thermonuclease family protein [Rhizobium sp. 'Codium 1']|uniref:thermonuclease family protein n=1 Tax=Rhizobium sp. 'Codium 1' TaxID=2940484 RepID=UPI003B63CA45